MHLRLGFLVAPRARLGLGLGIGLGQGQCDLPPLTTLAGTWNSNVCPGLAVSGTVSATWSWLGCALEEEFGQGLCRARIESGHLLPERRDPHELLPRHPCLRDVCLHRRHLLSRWRWHLAQRGRRRFRLWCRVSARMGLRRMPSLRGGKTADVINVVCCCRCLSHYKYTWGGSPGTKLGHIHRSRMVVARRSTHHGHIGRPHGPPRGRRPARPDTHWTHTTHTQLTKLEPGPAPK